MDIILLEGIRKLGAFGDQVSVKDGYARNFLIPRGKAIVASKANIKAFEAQKASIANKNNKLKEDAEQLANTLSGMSLNFVRHSADDGRMYGSVTKSDVAKAIYDNINIDISNYEIELNTKIKSIGEYTATIHLHHDVNVQVNLIVTRTGIASSSML